MATLSSAHLLAVASTHDDDRRDRLDQLHGLVEDLLPHPDLLGDAATSLAEAPAGRRPGAGHRTRRGEPSAGGARWLRPRPRTRGAGPAGPPHRAAATAWHGAGGRQPGGHARPLDRRRRLPRRRRAARAPRRGAHGGRLRHRRGDCRHLARRRRHRHLPRPVRRPPTGPHARPRDGVGARPHGARRTADRPADPSSTTNRCRGTRRARCAGETVRARSPRWLARSPPPAPSSTALASHGSTARWSTASHSAIASAASWTTPRCRASAPRSPVPRRSVPGCRCDVDPGRRPASVQAP